MMPSAPCAHNHSEGSGIESLKVFSLQPNSLLFNSILLG